MEKYSIISIKDADQNDVQLPHGTYEGTFGGYTAMVNHQNVIFFLKTDKGVRGIGYKVKITISENENCFEIID